MSTSDLKMVPSVSSGSSDRPESSGYCDGPAEELSSMTDLCVGYIVSCVSIGL